MSIFLYKFSKTYSIIPLRYCKVIMKKILVLLLSFIFVFSLVLSGCSSNPCKKGHNYGGWTVTKSATCTEDGEVVRFCLNEGCEHKETAVISKLGHDLDFVEARESTCYLQGCCDHYYCNNCEEVLNIEHEIVDESLIFQEYAAHDVAHGENKILVAPGQNKEGLAHQRCVNYERCGYYIAVILEANSGSENGGEGEWSEPA